MALPFGLTADALGAAVAEEDPESLAAASRLRARFDPGLAAAALTQAALRRQARAKFGADAETMFFTRDGLEQATRPAIAEHHARRFVAAGVRRVIDLGCGIGSDALAFARAGLEVVAVERDPDTAAVAAANLGGRATVVCAAPSSAGNLWPTRCGLRRSGAGGTSAAGPGGWRTSPRRGRSYRPAGRSPVSRGQARSRAAARGDPPPPKGVPQPPGRRVEAGLWGRPGADLAYARPGLAADESAPYRPADESAPYRLAAAAPGGFGPRSR